MSAGASRQLMRLAAIALNAAVLVVGPGAAVAAPRTHTIIIDKMKFGSVPKNVHEGDVILWVNRDIFRHTATARDGNFNIVLAPSSRGKTVVKRGGAFYCIYHSGMTGRLFVASK